MDPASLISNPQNTLVQEPGVKTRDTTLTRTLAVPHESLSRWDVPTPSNRVGALSSKKRRLRGESNSDEEEHDLGQYPSPPPSRRAGSRGRKFACPFRKHDPVVYCLADHNTCAVSSWPNTARLKCPPPAGITPEQEKELKSRKKSSPGQSEEDKWNNIYSLLFPTEVTPSCYFEPILEPGCHCHWPGANEMDSLECYLRCQVPHLVRTTLNERARRHRKPMQARLLDIIYKITQDCVEQACQEFKRCHNTEPNHVKQKQQESKIRSDVMQEAHADRVLPPVEDSGANIQNFEAQDQFSGIPFEDCNDESTNFLESIIRVTPQVVGRSEQVDTIRQQPRMVAAVGTSFSDSDYCIFCYNPQEECSCVFDFDPIALV